MELINVNVIEAQTPQAALQRFSQMFGASVLWPLVGACTQKPPFGRDDQIFRRRVESFCDERLTHFWSVGVSGIYQIHAQFKGAAQNSDSFLLVRWRSPDAWACQAHGSEAETIDCQVSANRKGSAGSGGLLSNLLHRVFSFNGWKDAPLRRHRPVAP